MKNDKKLPKGLLEELAELTRKICDIDITQDLQENIKRRQRVAHQLSKGVDWIYFCDLASAVYAFASEDTDLLEQMCKVLEVLGWQVVDDEQQPG